MVPEAPLEPVGHGRAPAGEGWFVLNMRDARWLDGDHGKYTRFEGELRWPELGLNVGVLQPGQPACLYHREENQEDFLILSGECVLLVEGEERPLKQWDFVHCPAWTDHVFVGAGSGPCAILAVGARASRKVVYPVSELAERYGASASEETDDPKQAYAHNVPNVDVAFDERWIS